MLNFDEQRKFDFNERLYESGFSFSLDDLDDDDDVQPISPVREVIRQKLNFDLFLMSHVFQPLNLKVENNKDVNYAWKEETYNGEQHYIAYIHIEMNGRKKSIHNLYVDLNQVTNELQIGNCSSFKKSKWFNISYPLIKICETYKKGPVYISDINVDIPFSTKSNLSSVLDDMQLPLVPITITESISFYRTVWNNVGYYFPLKGPNTEDFTEIDNNVKFSHDFVQHFAGTYNKFFSNENDRVQCPLYFKAFESFDDFKKVCKILCDCHGITVKTEFDFNFTDSNYDEKIKEFEYLISEKLGIEIKRNNEINEQEAKAKNKLIDILSENVLSHFESINSKSVNILSIKNMFKQRKSKDVYRKFDLPVIELILKDNGINIEKLVEKYESNWRDNFFKLADLFYKHFEKLGCEEKSDFEFFVVQILLYSRTDAVLRKQNGTNISFDDLTQEEVECIKNLTLDSLKPTIDYRSGRWKIEDLNDPRYVKTEEMECMYQHMFDVFGIYSSYFVDTDEIDYHTYNKFLLLQRFVYTLYKLCVTNEDELKDDIKEDALYNTQYTNISFNGFGGYIAFNCSEIPMKLNSYRQLYKFITYIAYIIENSYDIHIPFIGCADYNSSRYERRQLLDKYGVHIPEVKEIIEQEFSLDNKPNIKLLNTVSINRMLTTIFTNIDKQI